MSVEYSLFFVDWNKFSKGASSSEDEYELMESNSNEEAADSLFPLSMDLIETIDLLYKTILPNENPKGFFQKLLAKIEQRAADKSEDLPEIDKLNELFSHLFWGWRDESFKIYELESELEMMELAWCPPTVKKYAELFKTIDLAILKRRFSLFGIKNNIGDYDAFCEYCNQWGSLICKCAEKEQGLLIYTYA